MMRQHSVYDVDSEALLKANSYEKIVLQLDIYYGIAKRQILRYQNVTSGLFPATSDEKEEASIRESIYCAVSIWSLFQAYRSIDDDRGKSCELGGCVVKCMRGILSCWLRQTELVEQFKKKQCCQHSLHSVVHLQTGLELYTSDEYPHLQIDVVSLYLLYLVQMITSGLQIVYTRDEVSFVQNLVYYIERAYRTPDYGVWQRGSKYNDNTPEIHASSIGMAKCALEAMNGFNLFGQMGASWSVIYVDIDAHYQNRGIFETLLPRESCSKDVDASLISTINFPAFATHETHLCQLTETNILNKLKGRYGFKRFLRDGYKNVLENPGRKYYNAGETKIFENIENEWPIFYLFLSIAAVFKGDMQKAEKYVGEVRDLARYDSNGDMVIPLFYYVPSECVEAERQEPGSQERLASDIGSGALCSDGEPIFSLWNQSLYIISQLLISNLLNINELDPIRRYLPSYNRPIKIDRHSVFQGSTASDLVVQVVLVAESLRLQTMMATYGLQTQTPQEVEPVQIWSSKQLERVYKYLGANEKLGLTGRPMRPVGILGTSKVYRICGTTVICYPLMFEVSQFYLYRDMALLIDDIKAEMRFVSRYWRLSGRPTVCLIVREEHMRDPQFHKLVELLAMLKQGHCDNIFKVRIGRLQNLLASSCIEHLDFMKTINQSIEKFEMKPLTQRAHDFIGYQSLTDVPKIVATSCDSFVKHRINKQEYEAMSTNDIIEVIANNEQPECMFIRAQLYHLLINRHGPEFFFSNATVLRHVEELYQRASAHQYWAVVRYCSSLLGHTVDSISPFITSILVSGRQISVGTFGREEVTFDKPLIPYEIHAIMYNTVQKYDVIEAVLQQEVVVYIGRLIATNGYMFKGILKIRVAWVLEAMKHCLSISSQNPEDLPNLSPYRIRQLVRKVLTVNEWAASSDLTPLDRRKLEGCWCRVPAQFYSQLWDIIARTQKGYGLRIGGRPFLDSENVLDNMSRSELNFSLTVEETMMHLDRPEYRQIIVELLIILSIVLTRNPELVFTEVLDLDELVYQAYIMYAKDSGKLDENELSYSEATTLFVNLHQSITNGYLARAVINSILSRTELSSLDYDPSSNNYCIIS